MPKAGLGRLLEEARKRLSAANLPPVNLTEESVGVPVPAEAKAPPPPERWDLSLMGRTVVCGVEGRFDGAGMFVAVDGRRWGPGAIFEACPAPVLAPTPGMVVDIGGRTHEVVTVMQDIVVMSRGEWVTVADFGLKARDRSKPPFDDSDIPF